MDVKESIKKIVMKWVTVPISFLVIALTGAAMNLPDQFFKTEEKHKLVVAYGLNAVYLGLYSGVIAGLMVDKLSNLISYIISAVLALIGYAGLAFVCEEEGTFINILILVLFFLTGLSGSIATITSVVSLAKNFDSGRAALMLVGICVTYWKLASGMDNSLHQAFLKDSSNFVYFIVVGSIVVITLIIAALAMTKVELGKILDTISKEGDVQGIFVYVIVTAALLFVFFITGSVLGLYIVASSVFLFFLFLNFLALGLAVFLIYKMIKSGKGMSVGGLVGGLKKPEEFTTGQMFGKKFYIYMCIVAFCILGTSLTFEDLLIGQGVKGGEASGSLAGAISALWFADVISRFVGGLLAYFMMEKLTTSWILMVVFSGVAFIGHTAGIIVFAADAGKSGALFAPAILVGLGSGAIWSIIPIELVEHAKFKAFGQNWGTVLLFGMVGFLFFRFINDVTDENTLIASILNAVFALIALVFAILGHSDFKANAKPAKGGAANQNSGAK